ncbi:hypothetical protein [Saccharopolyspora sp. NPDC002376]
MKQRGLLKKIAKAAKRRKIRWGFAREGGNHTIYQLGEMRLPIPRHSEIGENTAMDIFKECQKELGEKWWL